MRKRKPSPLDTGNGRGDVMGKIKRRDLLRGAAATAAGLAVVPALGDPAEASADPGSAFRGGNSRCTTPGAADFPKVGGNYGNQNYTSLGRIDHEQRPAARRRLAQPDRGRHHHRHQPEHRGRGRRRALHRVGVRQRLRGRRRDRRHEVGVPADPRHPDPARRRGRRRQGLHPRPRQLDHRARPGHRRGRLGEADQRLRQHGEGRRHPPRRRAVRRHPRQRPRRRAGASSAANGDLLWHFWGAPGPGELGNDTWEGASWQTGGATPWMHPALDPELGLVYWTFGNARGSRSSQDGSAARRA